MALQKYDPRLLDCLLSKNFLVTYGPANLKL